MDALFHSQAAGACDVPTGYGAVDGFKLDVDQSTNTPTETDSGLGVMRGPEEFRWVYLLFTGIGHDVYWTLPSSAGAFMLDRTARIYFPISSASGTFGVGTAIYTPGNNGIFVYTYYSASPRHYYFSGSVLAFYYD